MPHNSEDRQTLDDLHARMDGFAVQIDELFDMRRRRRLKTGMRRAAWFLAGIAYVVCFIVLIDEELVALLKAGVVAAGVYGLARFGIWAAEGFID